MGQWEFDRRLGELHGVATFQVLGFDDPGADNLNGTGSGSVSTGHFVVELRDGAAEGHVTELPVHIVRARSGGVTQPNSVILDDPCVLLFDFNAIHNFTRRLFHFTELMHVIPEFGFGNHRIGGEQEHAVGFWIGMIVGGGLATNHLILT